MTDNDSKYSSVASMLLSDPPFFLQVLSVYYPLFEKDIDKYWDILVKGEAYYTDYSDHIGSYYSPEIGLCYNSAVIWSRELQDKWELGFFDPYLGEEIGIGKSDKLPLSLSDEISCYLEMVNKESVHDFKPEDSEYTEDTRWMEDHYELNKSIEEELRKNFKRLRELEYAALQEENKKAILLNSSIWKNTIAPELSMEMVKNFLDEELRKHEEKVKAEAAMPKPPEEPIRDIGE